MIKMKLGDLAKVISGELINLDSAVEFSGQVVTDSKKVKTGDIFVAICGEKRDGHDFVPEAIKAGAVAALVERKISDHPQILVQESSGAPEIYSQPTIWALAKLAKYFHQNFLSLTTIAITGSSGKTTTKDLIAQLSNLIGESVYTQGSANNEIGLPLTVFSCDEKTKLLILEMGARHVGNIKYLTDIAKPNYAIITHIGSAHLEIFGSQENLFNTKAEIIKDLNEKDWAILNLDDKNTQKLRTLTRAKIFTFGTCKEADLSASEIRIDSLGRTSFVMHYKDQNAQVNLSLIGEHNVLNALAAAAPFLLENKDLQLVAHLLSSAKALSPLRMELIKLNEGILLLNDSYNANFESMKAALLTLQKIGKERRKIAILGEMRELGEKRQELHNAIGCLAAEINVDQLLVTGEGARELIVGARSVNTWPGKATYCENNQTLANYAKELLRPHDVILIKASRVVALEEVARELIEFKGEA